MAHNESSEFNHTLRDPSVTTNTSCPLPDSKVHDWYYRHTSLTGTRLDYPPSTVIYSFHEDLSLPPSLPYHSVDGRRNPTDRGKGHKDELV